MTRLVLKDDLLDAQVLRALGSAPYGGADIGECLAAARHVKGTDLEGWFTSWTAAANAASALAEHAESAGHDESARLAHLRAATYHRTAGLMLMGVPVDARLIEAHGRQRDAFRRSVALMDLPPTEVDIPFEETHLPGYFFPATSDPEPRATVILLNGYDGTREELHVLNGAAALARGYHVLAFDGPGQGSMLIERGMPMRFDYEVVISAIIDFLITMPEVDPDRIALIGLSLGAFLGPRAASEEHRIAALIADSGSVDLYATFLARLPGPLRSAFDEGKGWARDLVAKEMHSLSKKPTAGWAIRRGLQVHGVEDPLDYVDAMRGFTLEGIAERITCPTWVCHAENDEIAASAPRLVEHLTCEKELVRFTAAEGADDHCEIGARLLYHARSFGWLDERLRPER